MEKLNIKKVGVLFILLNGFINLSSRLKEDQQQFVTGNEVATKRLLKYVELMSDRRSSTQWNTHDPYLVYDTITYAIYKAVYYSEQLFDVMDELQKIMKNEAKRNLISNEQYMGYRRCNFELRQLITKLKCVQNYTIDLNDWHGGLDDEIIISI